MTSRRERAPAGASNFAGGGNASSRQASGRIETARMGSTARSLQGSAREIDIPGFRRLPGLPLVNISDRPMISHRDSKLPTQRGDTQAFGGSNSLSSSVMNQYRQPDSYAERTRDILKVLHDKTYGGKIAKTKAEVDALGDYNAFSKPRPSMEHPLRTVLLDPDVNNIPPCKTRTELLKKVKLSGAPHPSFDLDHDGWVSQEDYRLAKRFDFDGNGVLDPYERQIAKQVMADEFFKKHGHELEKYGPQFKQNSHKQNVETLANSHNFERMYESLKSIERKLTAESSEPILSCMRAPDQSLLVHNYYTDKFDATAWNDFDAIPRSSSKFGLTDHGGSRKRLMFSRREVVRVGNQHKLDLAEDSKPKYNLRRLNLITDIAVENS